MVLLIRRAAAAAADDMMLLLLHVRPSKSQCLEASACDSASAPESDVLTDPSARHVAAEIRTHSVLQQLCRLQAELVILRGEHAT